MPLIIATLLAATTTALSSPTDESHVCRTAAVCASVPETVSAALGRDGYQARRTTDREGDPLIESAAAGYHFSIQFYGCEAHKQCSSLRFITGVDGDRRGALAQINEWNRANRFAGLYLDSDGAMIMNYDVTTLGGLSDRNFADVLDWWSTELGELDVFLRAHPSAPSSPAPPPARK